MPRGEYKLFYDNAHPRDARVVFEEETHKYFVDGQRVSLSVSGLWGQYFTEFDPDAAVDKFFHNWSADPFGKYFQLIKYMDLVLGYSVEEQKKGILTLWSNNGTHSADQGTELHSNIEKHLNDESVEDGSVEFVHYLRWK